MTETTESIKKGLEAIGLQPGNKVLVHSSLSSFGQVDGGADAVIDALLSAVGLGGTVLVPTLTGSGDLSPANPPKFDPKQTPCWTGRIPETFRKRANAVRSLHPTHSAAAIGADAHRLTAEHEYSVTPCDGKSPYGKLAEHDDGFILLIGCSHESNTTFHHVEEIAGVDYHMQREFAEATILLDDKEVRRNYLLHQYGTSRQFSVIEPLFIERGAQKTGRIGQSEVRLINARQMVEITLQSLKANQRILCKS